MKKFITIIVLFIIASDCFSQTDTILNYKGKRLYYSNYPLPNTATRYFNGFGGFVSFYDTARLAFSVTTTGSGAATYNSSTGVFNIPTPAAVSAWLLTGNASIDTSVNFLGTTDSKVLYLKTKGTRGLTIDTLQRTILGNLSIPTFATDSAQLLLNNRGLSFKRGDGTTMGTRLGVSYATGEFIIAGNNSGFNYMEGATSEFKVTSAGVGTFNSTVNSPKFVSSASSGVVADFFTTGSGNAQVYLPNTNYLGGAAALIGTGSVGPTVAGFKLQLYNQQLGTYPDRWYGFGSGSFSSSATEVPSAKLNVYSTTQGFLPPVQTTAQRNAGGISTGTLAGGSGYTNGSYVAKTITGGTGVGATATITVSGGAITVFAVIYAGAGYIVGDVLSASGLGGGTGFSWTVTAITAPATGLLIFDSDSASLFQYTGSAWQNLYNTGGAGGVAWGAITGTLTDQTDLNTALGLKAPLASPTFTGTVTIPTPFTLGATSVTATGTELNYVAGVTSAIQTQFSGKAALATANIFTTNGAVSAPANTFNGTWYSGGSTTTTKPFLLIEPSGATSTNWNANGTGLAVNGASGSTADLFNVQLNAAARFRIASTGAITANSSLTITGDILTAGAIYRSTNNGIFSIYNDGAGGALLQFYGSAHATLPNRMKITSTNGVGIGLDPTAVLHIKASTATASTGQIKLAEGTRQTAAEDGTINYIANNLEFVETSTVYTLAKTLTATATLDFGSTAAGTATDLTITVTGAADGDPVSVGVPNGSTVANGSFTAWVSATNTVTVRFSNSNLVTALDPASGTFRASVIRY